MPFNIEKFQVLQVTTTTTKKKYDYKVCGAELKSVQCAEDLGGKIPSNLKSSQHNNDAAHEVNRMSGFINRNFSFKNKGVL